MRRTLLCLFLLSGCASGRAVLLPGAEASTGPDGAGVQTRGDGLTLAVDGTAWQRVPVGDRITPLWVHLENRSERAIEVRAAEFSLAAPGASARAALPVMRAADSRMDEAPLSDPSSDGASCPYLGGMVGNGGEGYRPVQVSNFDALRANALPEGSLAPGESVEGYLYFDQVASLGSSVQLQAQLGRSTLRIPLVVQRQ